MKIFRIGLFGVGVILCSGCQRFQPSRPLSFSGTLELTEHSVGARVVGRVARLLVDEGQTVKKGQLLATLDRFEQASRDWDRTVALFKKGGAPLQTLEQAELTLQDQEVHSPVDGVVLVKVHERGEVITAGGAVLIIGDQADLWVRIFVPEGSVNRLALHQNASVRVDGLSRSFKGHVNYISPTAEFTPRNVQTPEERITQTFAVKVLLDERDANLRPGVAADVILEP